MVYSRAKGGMRREAAYRHSGEDPPLRVGHADRHAGEAADRAGAGGAASGRG